LKKKILITGGTGFLGSHYLKFLKKKKVFSLFSLSRNYPSLKKKVKGVRYLKCDLAIEKDLKKISKIKFDYIVNFAGNINHKEKVKTFNSHYKGVLNLVKSINRKHLLKFVQIGSSVEYGKINSPHHESKKIPLTKKIHSVYGQSKLLTTIFLMKENIKNNFPSVIIRPYLIYGPNQTIDRLIPFTIVSCLRNKEFPCSSGNQIRDFLYVSDAINFIYKIMTGNDVGKIFNLGSGKRIKVRNLINSIVKQCEGGKPLFGKLKLRKDELINLYPSISQARSKNWKPLVNLMKGLKITVKHFKKNLKNEK
jgi:nucleoside-diphosphate-sugar epimerase